ncbi:Spt20 family-domain-containing protein, partial [Lentinula aff. detonsa]
GLLERYKAELPSFTIHLHPDAWTLNSGSRCRYDNQYVGFLDEVRAHRIPADFVEIFHESGVRYFEGCLIVDLVDYRPHKPTDPPLETPEKTREVLHPTSETLWADLCVINTNSGGTLTDLQALEIESRILLATSAPLCLDPNPHLSRIANNVLRITTPSTTVSLKRKASALDAEKVEAEKARKEKIIGFLAPDSPRASRQCVLLLSPVSMRFLMSKQSSFQVPSVGITPTNTRRTAKFGICSSTSSAVDTAPCTVSDAHPSTSSCARLRFLQPILSSFFSCRTSSDVTIHSSAFSYKL